MNRIEELGSFSPISEGRSVASVGKMEMEKSDFTEFGFYGPPFLLFFETRKRHMINISNPRATVRRCTRSILHQAGAS